MAATAMSATMTIYSVIPCPDSLLRFLFMVNAPFLCGIRSKGGAMYYLNAELAENVKQSIYDLGKPRKYEV